MQKEFNHCFALCAYKESPYLENCIQSLLGQELKTKIIISTSTPNAYIKAAAAKYNLALFINPESKGIADDWNFAYKQADADYVTIAHQDDIYLNEYAKMFGQAASDSTLILFSDYFEISGDAVIKKNRLLALKQRMNFPLRFRAFQKSRFVRKRVLSFGSSICCPSVTFNKARLADFEFDQTFSCDLDWDAWSRIADKKGGFVYIHRPLMSHRIHEASETTRLLESGQRFNEDLRMFRKFWPDTVARFLMRRYSKSAENNKKLL